MKTDLFLIYKLGLMAFCLLLVPAQAQCSWEDQCEDAVCPTGMVCSQQQQHCVCETENIYDWQQDFDLVATIFDFSRYNQDFENGEPDPVGVAVRLGADDNPVFTNSDRFATWYTETPGVNMMTQISMELQWLDGKYQLGSQDFFPIDDQLLGNEGEEHNYHFTSKTSWTVDYNGGEYIHLRYDDGILLYLNRWLVVNEPGLHFNGTTLLDLDLVAGDSGMVPGNSYDLHIFHMERHLIESRFWIETDLLIHPPTCPNTCEIHEDCQHGLCDPFQRVCICQDGWAGDYCDQELCWNIDCGENGECDPYDGFCHCADGWAGDRCDIRSCSYHGDQELSGECACDLFYEGDDCQGCTPQAENGKFYICDRNGNSDNWKLKTVNYDQMIELVADRDYALPGTDGLDCKCDTDFGNWDGCWDLYYGYSRQAKTWGHDWGSCEDDDEERMVDLRFDQERQTSTSTSGSDSDPTSDQLYLARRSRVRQQDVDTYINTLEEENADWLPVSSASVLNLGSISFLLPIILLILNF